MGRRTDLLAVVVAGDDAPQRERVTTALDADGGFTVVASVDTTRMVSAATRLRPDAVVLLSPRPRHVDLGRIGSLTRDRAGRPPVVALLAEDPSAVDKRARTAGAATVGPIPAPGTEQAALAGLAEEIRLLSGLR